MLIRIRKSKENKLTAKMQSQKLYLIKLYFIFLLLAILLESTSYITIYGITIYYHKKCLKGINIYFKVNYTIT